MARSALPPAESPNLRAALQEIPNLHVRLAASSIPAAGSQAAKDGRSSIGQGAFDLSVAALVVSLDHLETWRRLVLDADYMPRFAYFGLVRSALEGAALTRWLCEPGIDTDDTRLRRGVGAMWADLEDRRKLEAEVGHPAVHTARWRPASERQKRLLAEAAKRGLLVVTPKGTKPASVPDRTTLFHQFVFAGRDEPQFGSTGRAIYRLLSAPTHGRQYAIMGNAAAEVLAMETGRPGSRIASITPSEPIAAVTTVLGLLGVRAALSDLEHYAGRR